MKALTTRQQEVYDLIRDHISTTGMPPTRAEIATRLGFRSPNAAEEHLKALARKGVIEIVSGASRGIRLLMEEEAGLPLIGRVAAGEPLLATQHIEGHYQVDPGMFKPSADFLLRVSGMSMRDIGILDGDLLAVHKTQDVRNGQVVVARIDDEVTVKRLKKQGNTVQLLPENSELKDWRSALSATATGSNQPPLLALAIYTVSFCLSPLHWGDIVSVTRRPVIHKPLLFI
jgi:repressor LexA